MMVNKAILNNLKHILVDAMVFLGDLKQYIIASKLITFGANGVSVFQGVKTCVTV
jgi:hypothetical protein